MSGVSIDMTHVIKLARDIGWAAQMMPMASEAALDKAGEMVQAEAKAAAPVDTGTLQKSIFLKPTKSTRRIGSDVYYGVFQEFGTSRMPPHPWLFQAGEHGREELVKGVLAAVSAGLDVRA